MSTTFSNKIALAVTVLFLSGILHAETPARVISGNNGSKVDFAKFDVGGETAFTNGERNRILARNPGAQVTALTPSPDEVNVSTCVLVFNNFSDYLDALTTKKGCKAKVRELNNALTESQNDADAPNGEAQDLKERKSWLRGYCQGLP